MRMWMLEPKLLCNKHLIGEHGEIHKFRHVFIKGHSIMGRLYPVVQIEPNSMSSRHDELAKEMIKRGIEHKSPYVQPDLTLNYGTKSIYAKVDLSVSLRDLSNRCSKCKERINETQKKNTG